MGDTEESDYVAQGDTEELYYVGTQESDSVALLSLLHFSLEAVPSLLIAWERLICLNQAALGLVCHLRHLTTLPPPPRWSPRGH